jgi:NAD(P)-dependent dehydrogenase (short-subunit alcohol dehydrogenase family)
MHKRTALITGATDGIGKQTAVELAKKDFHVIIHGRNKEKASKALKEIREITGSKALSIAFGDFSSLKDVHQLAESLTAEFDCIDVLVNNAGVYMNKKILTEDGFEMTFAVNHLAHFLLTNLLLELFKQSDDARIVNVSSIAHLNSRLDWENLNAEKLFSPYGAYSLSKLANVLFSNELANRVSGSNIKSNSLHPGVITTKLLKAGFNMTGSSVKKGAETSVFVSSSEKLKSLSGKYFVDCKIADINLIAADKDITKKFWEVSSEMTRLKLKP